MALPLSAVTGIVMLPEPSKPVAVPVAAPERAIVLAVASLVAVAALPVHEPDDPVVFPDPVMYPCAFTNAVVAIFVLLSEVAGVGASAVTTPLVFMTEIPAGAELLSLCAPIRI